MADSCKIITVTVAPTCSDTIPCPDGQHCVDGSCVPDTPGVNWTAIIPILGLGLIGGFMLMNSGDSKGVDLPKATYPEGIPPGLK